MSEFFEFWESVPDDIRQFVGVAVGVSIMALAGVASFWLWNRIVNADEVEKRKHQRRLNKLELKEKGIPKCNHRYELDELKDRLGTTNERLARWNSDHDRVLSTHEERLRKIENNEYKNSGASPLFTEKRQEEIRRAEMRGKTSDGRPIL